MTNSSTRPVVGAGLLLGIGLGGFLDGIALHQILQWHNMLSSVIPPVDLVAMKINMVYDGLFHLGTWLFTAAGVVALFRAGLRGATWSARALLGGMLGGWGAFNLVEGLIDHQVLELHHVHPGSNELAWDIGFLLFGVGLLGLGWALAGSGRRAREARPSERAAPAQPIRTTA